MKANNLLVWIYDLTIIFIYTSVFIGFFIAATDSRTEEKQGRLIKPFPKDTTNKHPECNACRIAHQYSLNINLKHYGDSVE